MSRVPFDKMDHSFSSSASPPSPNVFVVPSQTTLDLVEGKKSNRKSKKLANAGPLLGLRTGSRA